jgi:hypothetical protein
VLHGLPLERGFRYPQPTRATAVDRQ